LSASFRETTTTTTTTTTDDDDDDTDDDINDAQSDERERETHRERLYSTQTHQGNVMTKFAAFPQVTRRMCN
jgi:hypothetical protein